MIIKDRAFMPEEIPSNKLILRCIKEHQLQLFRLQKLNNYYEGKHDILKRTMSDGLPNEKLVCNHAEYISDMAVGYVFGVPVQYSGDKEKVIELNNLFTEIDEDSHNNELANDISVFGHGLELVFMSDNEVPEPDLACLSPLNSFLVVDDTIQHKPMFSCTYSVKCDLDGAQKGYDIVLRTEKFVLHYHAESLDNENMVRIEENDEEHFFGRVPVVEYLNNKRGTGDFEGVLTLIDAYNILQSDRVNDKEQLVDALLAVTGVSFGDDDTEMTKTARLIKEHKLLELPENADAKWLVKGMNETEIEVLKKSLKDDIHEFSKVPCLTDENFASNASGVAMKYKLLGFEQLGKTKERYFKKGLRKRLELIQNINAIKAKSVDVSKIDITMKRSLPVDDELLARIAKETEGFISWETRLLNFNPELDPEEERERLKEEKKENMEMQQQAFGSYEFKQGGVADDDDEE